MLPVHSTAMNINLTSQCCTFVESNIDRYSASIRMCIRFSAMSGREVFLEDSIGNRVDSLGNAIHGDRSINC